MPFIVFFLTFARQQLLVQESQSTEASASEISTPRSKKSLKPLLDEDQVGFIFQPSRISHHLVATTSASDLSFLYTALIWSRVLGATKRLTVYLLHLGTADP